MAKFKGLQDARTFKVSAGLGDETSCVVNNLQKEAINDRIQARLRSKDAQIAFIQSQLNKEPKAKPQTSDKSLAEKINEIEAGIDKKAKIYEDFAKFEDDLDRFEMDLAEINNEKKSSGSSSQGAKSHGMPSSSNDNFKFEVQNEFSEIDKLLGQMKQKGEKANEVE